MLNKKIIKENLFPNLVTKEDYVALVEYYLKSNIKAHNVEKNLVIWKQVKNSFHQIFYKNFLMDLEFIIFMRNLTLLNQFFFNKVKR